MEYILVLNCGSSSLKFGLVDPRSDERPLSGLAEKLGAEGSRLIVKRGDEEQIFPLPPQANHADALSELEAILRAEPAFWESLLAIGHRVVHGGERFSEPTFITADVKKTIADVAFLAPLHNPVDLLGIERSEQIFPSKPHIAVFDTAFFQQMPPKAYRYPIPEKFYKEYGLRRYGFHGSSHEYVSNKAAEMLGKTLPDCNFITAHLGNGCSVAAIRQGAAVDVSMGATPLAGLMMGTRAGDLDPSITLLLQTELGYGAEEIYDVLNRKSGLLGVSQLSNDCRTLEEAAENGHELAQLALDMFCYRLAKFIGSFMIVAGPVDGIVFTGGIGENSAYVREKTAAYLSPTGFVLDPERNKACRFGKSGFVQAEYGRPILVIPTDEELVIAQKSWSCLQEELTTRVAIGATNRAIEDI